MKITWLQKSARFKASQEPIYWRTADDPSLSATVSVSTCTGGTSVASPGSARTLVPLGPPPHHTATPRSTPTLHVIVKFRLAYAYNSNI